MLTFSPEKLLVVLVVALVLLGPDKLPQVARQLGGAWATLRRLHARMEEEVRSTVPDLPSSREIANAVRSPMAFLDSLATMDPPTETASTGTSANVVTSTEINTTEPPGTAPEGSTWAGGAAVPVGAAAGGETQVEVPDPAFVDPELGGADDRVAPDRAAPDRAAPDHGAPAPAPDGPAGGEAWYAPGDPSLN